MNAKQNLATTAVTLAAGGSNEILTAEALQGMVFFGMTLGAWLYCLTFASVSIMLFLNAGKLWRNHISKWFK